MAGRMFPIQTQRGAKPHPLLIPWAFAELAYSVYAGNYGKSQSLEHLAERGGFGPNEMDLFLPDWRHRCEVFRQLEQERDKLSNEVQDLCGQIDRWREATGCSCPSAYAEKSKKLAEA